MITWEWWGRGLPYGEALARQRARRDAVAVGRAPEGLALLEHAPVVTYGRRVAPGNPPDEVLRAAGLEVAHTERGGLATWHGPGQLVAYAFLQVERRRLGVRGLVQALEQGVIDWLGEQGVVASRREGAPGVWVPDGKIAAVGLNVSGGTSMHGLALNLRVDPWSLPPIVPCGLAGAGVASLHLLRPAGAPEPHAAAAGFARSLTSALERATALDAGEGTR